MADVKRQIQGLVSSEIDMQPSTSCEKYLQIETNSAVPRHVGEETMSKMSSTSQSLMSTSSCTKEYKSSMLESCPFNSKNGITKSHMESQMSSSQTNGGPCMQV